MIRNFIENSFRLATACQPSWRVLFVSGNESADMDSCITPIVTAFLLQKTTIRNSFDAVLPLINVSKDELHLRRDVQWLLNAFKTDREPFLFLEDIACIDERVRRASSLFLVDCNRPSSSISTLVGQNVVGLIDHHEDENLYHKEIAAGTGIRVIRKCGSCCSLVLTHFSNIIDPQIFQNDPDFCRLAWAPILLDTSGLQKKMQPDDKQAARILDPSMNQDLELRSNTASDAHLDEYHAKLESLKQDIGGFSIPELLKRDYKEWKSDGISLGISSLPLSLEQLGKTHEDWLSQIAQYARDKGVQILVIMCVFREDESTSKNKRRQLAIWSVQDDEISGKIQNFIDRHSTDLQLVEISKTSTETENFIRMEQKKVSATRKLVAPMIRSSLSS